MKLLALLTLEVLPPRKSRDIMAVSPSPSNAIMPCKQLPLLHLIEHLQSSNSFFLILVNPPLPDKLNISRRLAISKALILKAASLRLERRIRRESLELDPPRRKVRYHRTTEGIIRSNRLIKNQPERSNTRLRRL